MQQQDLVIYKYDGQLKRKLIEIKESQHLSPSERTTALQYVDFLHATNLSKGRVVKNILFLLTLSRDFGMKLDKITKENIQSVTGKISKNESYAEWTKHDMKALIKKYIKWLLDDKYNQKDWEWIKTRIAKNKIRLPAEGDILSAEEVDMMINNANNPRDKAIFAVMYETACRPSEILTLRLRNCKADEHGFVLNISKSKTYQRPVRITNKGAANYLRAWLNVHPRRNDDEAPVWISSQDITKNLNLFSLRKNMLIVAERSGLCVLAREKGKRKASLKTISGKRIYPYLFRHSRITHLLLNPKLPHSVVKRMVGWTHESTQIGTYLHMSDQTVDNIILEANGEIAKDGKKKEINLASSVVCYQCKTANAYNNKYCIGCNFPLDANKIAELMQIAKSLQKHMDDDKKFESLDDQQIVELKQQYSKK